MEKRVSAYGETQETIAEMHRSRASVLVEAGIELLAFETVPDLVEDSRRPSSRRRQSPAS